MASTTEHQPGPINLRQEHPHAQRLLAAQSRLYSDAKNIRKLRLPVTFALAALSVVAGIVVPDARPGLGLAGAVVSLAWSALAFTPERRKRSTAVGTQEEFDCYVFELPWKSSAVEYPSATTIAEAADRYKGDRLSNWYPKTGPLPRPLDVLVCQRGNLGWGTAAHRQYAYILTGIFFLLIVAAAAVTWLVDDGVFIALPLAAPAKELFELAREHRTSAESKESAESKVRKVWDQALADPSAVTVADCRDMQDLIMAIRRNNASVPDWFDNRRRRNYETSMLLSTEHYIEQAIAAGQTQTP
ncbi:hypothetical protein KM427_01575 [Nocardioides sp. LMS-CY]|uniref:S-4TM family putative pore-forming effector n=1 Tax=Nocardioides sp. (strain LMS-CY) TaxID=2840457 RepID=UPI001C0059B2|nr:S-4TM family putative pore-forming effector [Nocardioides sp. LMS-CY]QWF22467.1 hypothetical protein KM427_01575 [Nocardioides sp. LMS-CY]